MFPAKQTGGGAKADQALPDFAGVALLVMSEGDDAISVDKGRLAFGALPGHAQMPAEDELVGLQ
jgi:hypothetical protein